MLEKVERWFFNVDAYHETLPIIEYKKCSFFPVNNSWEDDYGRVIPGKPLPPKWQTYVDRKGWEVVREPSFATRQECIDAATLYVENKMKYYKKAKEHLLKLEATE